MTRTFLGWREPALPAAAARLCDAFADANTGVLRLDGVIVALPGGRAGRRLKEILAAEAAARGLPLIPPRITTIGHLPELLYDAVRPIAPGPALRRAWAETARAADPEVLEELFPRRPDPDAVEEWGALGRELFRLHREVGAGGLRFRDVAARCRAAPLHDDGRRWRALAALQAAYEARLAAAGVADRDLARLAALETGRIGSGPVPDIWLIGVAEMSAVSRRVIAAVADRVHVLVHAPASEAERFDAMGCVVPGAWLGAPVPLDDGRLAVLDGPADQAIHVVRALAAADGRVRAEDVVIGVPDRGVVPYLEEELAAAGVPARDAAGTRVAGSGPFRLLAAVAEYLGGRRFDALAALARHPDLRLEPGDVSGRLDGYFAAHLPARIAAAVPGRPRLPGEASREGGAVAAYLRGLDGLLEDFETGGTLVERAEAAVALLARVYGERTLRADRPADRRLANALEAIARAAAELRALPPELDAPCSAAGGLRVLLDEVAGETVPSDPDRAAVELLGWLELHLDDAPMAIVTGFNEPYLPESVNAHAFLPNGLRTLLGLEDNDRRYARDAYQLTALLHARTEVRILAGRRTADGDPLRPSRLMFAADPGTIARRVRRFYDEAYAEFAGARGRPGAGDGRSPAGTGDPAAPAAPAVARFRLPPEPVIRLAEPITKLRVTDFRGLLADPYTWALQRALRLEPVDDAAREMDGRLFGHLAHRVLERFGGPGVPEASSDDVDAIRRRLDALLDEEAGRRFGRVAHVAVAVQIDQLRARLHAFARWQAERVRQGWRTHAVECSTPTGGAPFDVDGAPMRLSARVDRVDHHPETDRWAILDYKTGENAADPDGIHFRGRGRNRRWADLQLPLYHWLLPHLERPSGEPVLPPSEGRPARVELGYVSLPGDLEAVGTAMADWPPETLEHAIETARDTIRLVRAGVFTHDAAARPPFAAPPLSALLGLGQLVAAEAADVALGLAVPGPGEPAAPGEPAGPAGGPNGGGSNGGGPNGGGSP